jgi:hypothetical protein
MYFLASTWSNHIRSKTLKVRKVDNRELVPEEHRGYQVALSVSHQLALWSNNEI